MSDGRISIEIEVDGKEVKVVSNELDKLAKTAQDSGTPLKEAEKGLDDVGDSAKKAKVPLNDTEKAIDGVGEKSVKTGTSVKDMVLSFGLVKIASAAFKVVAQSLDSAISRFDTMQKYPKVLSALGFSAEESKESIGKLSEGIDGLPTKLDDVVASTQQMTSITGDLEKSTDTVLALNNAFLASGADAADASRGTEQYVQMLSSGTVDLQSWKSLQDTMPLALQKTAEAMGYVGASAQRDLYSALKDGEVTFSDFQNQLIELGTGTGMLADLAKENSLGIATSFGNLKNAVAKNMANILERFDKLTFELTGKNIAENIDSLKRIINTSFNVIGDVIDKTTPHVIAFKDGVQAVLPVVDALSPVIMGVVGAYVALQIINKTNATIAASRAIWETMAVTTAKITALTNAKTAAEIANNSVQAKYIAANLASMKLLTAKNIIIGLLTGSLSLSTVATLLKAKAVGVLSGALKLLTGPVGLVIVGIGLLVAAGTELYRWFNRATEDGQKLAKQSKELSGAMEELGDSVESSSGAYDKNQRNIQSTSEANQGLIDKIEELSTIEKKTAAEKKELAAYVYQLNGSMSDLNLIYSEEADALNQSSQYMRERVELMKEQETATAAQERLLEISKEQSEVDMRLKETNELRAEWNQKLEAGTVTSKEYKTSISELDEQEQLLKETTRGLTEEQKLAEETVTASMVSIAEATKNSVGSQMVSFADLSEAQTAAVENMRDRWNHYKDAATDMFNTLSDESELSVAEMTANMEENQRVIANWADNIATLATRGIDEGLLNTLRDAGPESAGYVNALVNASDDELQNLSTAFAEGGDVATEALAKSLGVENNEVVQSVTHLVTQTKATMTDEIKAADFGSIGKNVAQGLGQGINEGSKEAADASKDMAKDVTDASKDELDINSPSGVFKEIGLNTTGGLALGINDGTIKVMSAVTSLFNQIKSESRKQMEAIIAGFSPLPESMYSIGLNSMLGLQNGLNSQRASLMSTARSIANEIATTMQQALDINSPSGKFRDGVGRWIPEGVAVGIKENASTAYNAVKQLSSNLIKGSTPELALGLNGMSAMSAGHSIINNHSSVSSSNSNVPTNMGRVEALLEVIASKDPSLHVGKKEMATAIYQDVSELIDQANKTAGRNAGVIFG